MKREAIEPEITDPTDSNPKTNGLDTRKKERKDASLEAEALAYHTVQYHRRA